MAGRETSPEVGEFRSRLRLDIPPNPQARLVSSAVHLVPVYVYVYDIRIYEDLGYPPKPPNKIGH